MMGLMNSDDVTNNNNIKFEKKLLKCSHQDLLFVFLAKFSYSMATFSHSIPDHGIRINLLAAIGY